MAKSSRTIRLDLPSYQVKRTLWRREILYRAMKARKKAGVRYEKDALVEVEVLIYLAKGKGFFSRDVDNLVKNILDALQGRFLGSRSRLEEQLLNDDRQVCRVVVEKRPRPKKLAVTAGGRLLIRAYRKRLWR